MWLFVGPCFRNRSTEPLAGDSVPRLTGGLSLAHGGLMVDGRRCAEGCGVKQLVLSVFPGIGLLDRAFEEEGFCVVRGPDVLWGGDIRRFHPPAGRFDGVIGGPPCQAFSTLQAINRAMGRKPRFGNLIPEFERCVREAEPEWFVMENTPKAPRPAVKGYGVHSFNINNRQFREEQNRPRTWSFGCRGARSVLMVETSVFETERFEPCVTTTMGGHPVRSTNGIAKPLRSRSFAERLKLQGLPEDFKLPPFTARARDEAIGNGVPMAMGRAIAKAVAKAIELVAAGGAA